MPVSSPAGGHPVFRFAVLAAVTMLLVTVSAIGRAVGVPIGPTLEPAAAADFDCGSYKPLAPSGGVVRAVSNQAELNAALAAARPGDVVNLSDGVYTRVAYHSDQGHRSGTAAAPIVIQAAAGAAPIIDAGDNGSPSRRFAVSIIRMAHVKVRGLEIRNGIFGALSRGSDSVTFEHNHIHHLGQVGVATGGAESSAGYEPSSNTVIRCNRIHDTGMLDHEFGEGIYIGTGRTGAVDRTSGVLIEGNELHSIANEAVDVKRYTTKVTIRHNLIHDVTPYYGGAISLGLNKNDWGPADYLVEYNRIWNVSSGRHYAQAIAVAHGPTIIRNNTIWNVDTRISDSWPWTATIQIHGDDNSADWAYGFGNPSATRIDVIGNTIIGCNQGCIDSYTDPGQIKPTLTVQSNIVDRASTGDATNSTDIVVTAADLVGPVSGDADSGSGPGSGLRLRTAPPPTTAPPPPTTTARRSTTGVPTTPSTSARPTSIAPTSTSARDDSARPSRSRPAVASTPTSQRSTAPSPKPNPAGSGRPDIISVADRFPAASPDPRSAGVSTTTRNAGSTSTTRSTSTRSSTTIMESGRRRNASDLRVFLDANLGPDLGAGTGPAGALAPGRPDEPAWLVALMAAPTPDENVVRSTPTTVDNVRDAPPYNATTEPDDGAATAPVRRAAGDLPSTTLPSTTGGLTATR